MLVRNRFPRVQLWLRWMVVPNLGSSAKSCTGSSALSSVLAGLQSLVISSAVPGESGVPAHWSGISVGLRGLCAWMQAVAFPISLSSSITECLDRVGLYCWLVLGQDLVLTGLSPSLTLCES